MTKLELTVNETKTSVKDARHATFDFLGTRLSPAHRPKIPHSYMTVIAWAKPRPAIALRTAHPL